MLLQDFSEVFVNVLGGQFGALMLPTSILIDLPAAIFDYQMESSNMYSIFLVVDGIHLKLFE